MMFPLDAGAWLFSGMAMQDYRMRQLKEEMLQEFERSRPVYHHWEGQDRDIEMERAEKMARELLSDEHFRGDSQNRKGTFTTPEGIVYEGKLKDGKPDGKGIMKFPDGEKIESEWKNGQAEGSAIHTFANGGEYVGFFKEGRHHGQGTISLHDGTRYTGEFRNDIPNGQGSLSGADGFGYVGNFKDGLPHGKGILKLPQGTYEGELKEGKPNGRGVLTIPDVGSIEQMYHNGVAGEPGTLILPDGQRIALEYKDGKPHVPSRPPDNVGGEKAINGQSTKA